MNRFCPHCGHPSPDAHSLPFCPRCGNPAQAAQTHRMRTATAEDIDIEALISELNRLRTGSALLSAPPPTGQATLGMRQLHARLSTMHPVMRFLLEHPLMSASIIIAAGAGLIAAGPVVTVAGAALTALGGKVVLFSGIGILLSALVTGSGKMDAQGTKRLFMLSGAALAGGLLVAVLGTLISVLGGALGVLGTILVGAGITLAAARFGQILYLHRHEIAAVARQAFSRQSRQTSAMANTRTDDPQEGREIRVVRRSSPIARHGETKDRPRKAREIRVIRRRS